MIRILALILSVNFCLFSSALGESAFPDHVNESDLVSAQSNLTPTTKERGRIKSGVDNTRFMLAAAHSSSSSRKKGDQRKNRSDHTPSNNLNPNNLSQVRDGSSAFIGSSSIFDIRVPGDPRSNLESKSQIVEPSTSQPSWIDPKKVPGLSSPGDFLKRLGSVPRFDLHV
ncbi:MAG: hypothetical protein V1897_00675, partial [Pseudomonadota bacterium]